MYLLNNGKKEKYDKKKFHAYISNKCKNLAVNINEFIKRVEGGFASGMTLDEILNYCAEQAAGLITEDPDYNYLAASIELDRIYKSSQKTFSETMDLAFQLFGLNEPFYNYVCTNRDKLNKAIDNSRDNIFDYFGLKTLQKLFLFKCDEIVFESPQYLFMRVACQIHLNDFERTVETYHLLSNRYFIHATPTLFNSGKIRNNLSSCFLMGADDSIDGILETNNNIARVSAAGGGVAVHVSDYRAKGTISERTGLINNGIIPKLKVFNSMVRCINQSNNRVGSCAVYIEPWHSEIYEFLELRKNVGNDELRTRDLFLALWIPDLFMERVKKNRKWSLFCPYKAKNLTNVYGDEFNILYEKYEKEKLYEKQVNAQELWKTMISIQIETGNPYILFKDHCNRKSNQNNMGTIKSSNLCTEIIQYSTGKETSVCNLASIGLPSFIKTGTEIKHDYPIDISHHKYNFKKNKYFDFNLLYKVVKVVVRNINNIIDYGKYPYESAYINNQQTRPMGIGVQGMADLFAILNVSFESAEAKKLNKDIFETIYYAGIEASCELAREFGPYEFYKGSLIEKGYFQFDMWGITPEKYDWTVLRENVKKYGVRNSLLISLMPTATTASIFNFNECFEPFTSNIYMRRTVAGEFQMVNKYLIEELKKLKLWSVDMKNLIIMKDGSIADIKIIPARIRNIFKTVWEMKMKNIIDMAVDRSPYICQSQSLNIFIAQPKYSQVTSMHFYSWSKGLKTASYYLRTKPIAQAIKFTVNRESAKKTENSYNSDKMCYLENGTDCMSCGS